MRRSILYQPLAVLLAVIMLPPFSWISGAGRASSMSVTAQINVPGCTPSAGRIIQDLGGFCDPNWADTADVQQFENDTVSAWLTAHQLPQSEGALIYQFGRSDLRSELRGYMVLKLLDIASSTARTGHEQALYLGLQKKIQQYEIALYTAALDEYKRWNSDPCHWKPDPALAAQYQLAYDGTPFCVLGQAPANYAPSYDYFIAYGMLKGSYGKAISDQANGPLVQAQTGISLGLAIGAVALPAATVTGVIVGAIVFTAIKQIMPYAFRAFINTAAAGPLLSEVGTAAVAGTLVFLAVFAGVVAGFQIFSSAANEQNLANLNNKIASATATLPDLSKYVDDPVGKYKITAAFTAMTLPEFSSTQALPLHQDTDGQFIITYRGQSAASSPTLRYQDWAGTTWTASAYGGWWVQNGFTIGTGPDGSEIPVVATSSLSPTFFYSGWDTNPYSASVVGNNFLVTKGNPATTDKACPADPITGVTTTVLPTCLSYVSSSIQMMDYFKIGDSVILGDAKTVSLAHPPVFTSAAAATWSSNGAPNTFQITATGFPTPSITQSGALPNGIMFTAGNPARLSGTATSQGVFPITLTATNSVRTTTQNFTLTVGNAPTFTSANTAVFTAGQPGSFTIKTTGLPAPVLVSGLFLPGGLNFKDNGDGTATISGTPAVPSRNGPLCSLAIGCGILAVNDLGRTFQALTVTVNPAPLTTDSSPSGITFTISNPADGRTCPSSGSRITPATLNLYSEDGCVLAFPSTISGGTGTQRVFQNWGFDASNPRTVVAPSSAATYTAYYQTQYYLTTSAGPGGSISPGTGWVVPQFGGTASVSVSATPSAGYAFTGFTGNLTGATNPQVITMTAPQSVTANFGAVTATAVGAVSGSYSKSVNLTAAVSALNTALNPAVAGSLQFSVDGVNAGGPVAVNGAGTYSVPYTITKGQGSYIVQATFSGAAAGILGNSASNTLTVSANNVTLAPSATNPTAKGLSRNNMTALSYILRGRI